MKKNSISIVLGFLCICVIAAVVFVFWKNIKPDTLTEDSSVTEETVQTEASITSEAPVTSDAPIKSEAPIDSEPSDKSKADAGGSNDVDNLVIGKETVLGFDITNNYIGKNKPKPVSITKEINLKGKTYGNLAVELAVARYKTSDDTYADFLLIRSSMDAQNHDAYFLGKLNLKAVPNSTAVNMSDYQPKNQGGKQVYSVLYGTSSGIEAGYKDKHFEVGLSGSVQTSRETQKEKNYMDYSNQSIKSKNEFAVSYNYNPSLIADDSITRNINYACKNDEQRAVVYYETAESQYTLHISGEICVQAPLMILLEDGMIDDEIVPVPIPAYSIASVIEQQLEFGIGGGIPFDCTLTVNADGSISMTENTVSNGIIEAIAKEWEKENIKLIGEMIKTITLPATTTTKPAETTTTSTSTTRKVTTAPIITTTQKVTTKATTTVKTTITQPTQPIYTQPQNTEPTAPFVCNKNYYIVPLSNEKTCIQPTAGKKESNVIAGKFDKIKNNQWHFEKVNGKDEYYIVHSSGNVLDIYKWKMSDVGNKTNLWLYSKNSGSENDEIIKTQRFKIEIQNGGTVSILAAYKTKYRADVYGYAPTKEGANLQLYEKTSDAPDTLSTQLFKLIPAD